MCIKISGKNVNFDHKKIKKVTFYKKKKVVNIDINKILVSKEEPYGTKNLLDTVTSTNDWLC